MLIVTKITPEHERNSKIDLLENRSRNLEEKITEYVESNNKRINLLRDQVYLHPRRSYKILDSKNPKNARRRKGP